MFRVSGLGFWGLEFSATVLAVCLVDGLGGILMFLFEKDAGRVRDRTFKTHNSGCGSLPTAWAGLEDFALDCRRFQRYRGFQVSVSGYRFIVVGFSVFAGSSVC